MNPMAQLTIPSLRASVVPWLQRHQQNTPEEQQKQEAINESDFLAYVPALGM